MATSGDRYLATSGDFFMATDMLPGQEWGRIAVLLPPLSASRPLPPNDSS